MNKNVKQKGNQRNKNMKQKGKQMNKIKQKFSYSIMKIQVSSQTAKQSTININNLTNR